MREDSTFLSLAAAQRQLVVRALPDGRIAVRLSAEPLTEVAPGAFRDSRDLELRFFERRRAQLVMRTNASPLAQEWQRVPWYLDVRVVSRAVGASLGLIGSTLLLWPLAAWVRRRRSRPFGGTSADRWQHLAVRLLLVPGLLALGVLALAASGGSDLTSLNSALDPVLLVAYALAWLGVAGSAVVLWVAVRFWRDRVGSLWARVHHTLLAVASALLACFFVAWHIAGTSLNY